MDIFFVFRATKFYKFSCSLLHCSRISVNQSFYFYFTSLLPHSFAVYNFPLRFCVFSRQTDGMLLGLESVVHLVTAAPVDREWLLLKTSKFLYVSNLLILLWSFDDWNNVDLNLYAFYRVVFYFKSSKKSNNGTDVNAGQIPQLLYRVVTPENRTPNRQTEHSEPVYVLSREFSRAVSKVSCKTINIIACIYKVVNQNLTACINCLSYYT